MAGGGGRERQGRTGMSALLIAAAFGAGIGLGFLILWFRR
jgi:hypothetical protein